MLWPGPAALAILITQVAKPKFPGAPKGYVLIVWPKSNQLTKRTQVVVTQRYRLAFELKHNIGAEAAGHESGGQVPFPLPPTGAHGYT